MSIFHKRQGQMGFHDSYFFTQTIANFQHLLKNDHLKMMIINSLQFLVKNGYIEINGYTIMPNHFHVICRKLKNNGKESPMASLAKYTGHAFKNYLLVNNPEILIKYKSDKNDRAYQFWKRDPLAIPLNTENILIQKLDYIHDNPIAEKWDLCKLPESYRWSSANFYLSGIDEFNFLTHFRE